MPEIDMVQYPTGRLRSFVVPREYDWDSVQLYTILDQVQRGLEEFEEETVLEPEFMYTDRNGTATTGSLEELLEAGHQSPMDGEVEVEAGPVEGHIDYTTRVFRETDASLTARFSAPGAYVEEVEQALKDAGFSKPFIPRLTRKASTA